jgi:transposase
MVPQMIVHNLNLLTTGLNAGALLAAKGYDSDNIVKKAEGAGITVCIPPRQNRKDQRMYNKELYKKRHLVENAFLKLKRWGGLAMRYAKK